MECEDFQRFYDKSIYLYNWGNNTYSKRMVLQIICSKNTTNGMMDETGKIG